MPLDFRKEALKHIKRLEAYARKVEQAYEKANKELSRIAVSVNHPVDELFKLKDYPEIKARVDKVIQELHGSIEVAILNGEKLEWGYANKVNDTLAKTVTGLTVSEAAESTKYKRYFSQNTSALAAFQKRKENGLNLSKRVWNLTDQYKRDMELGLSVGISDGRSAAQLSRDLRSYLNEPNKLFRRVRDEYGNLVLSQNAKSYHPGQGVYRSSYKNALRMTRTEINMAYRAADQERWKQMDFVLGYKIARSNNPYPCPVCEALQGNYPKNFVWSGWHPQCRCVRTPILQDIDDFIADEDAILDGGQPIEVRKGTIDSTPKNFEEWVVRNRERIQNTKTPPYFISQNQDIIDNILKSAPSEIIMTDDILIDLKKRGFRITLGSDAIKKYNESAIQGFDLLSFDKDLSKLLESKGIIIRDKRLEIKHDDMLSFMGWKSENPDNIRLYYSGYRDKTDETFSMIRMFKYEDDYRSVENMLFSIPQSLRKHGIAKDIFKISYDYYNPIGINKMETLANKVVGGYVWAKYGYYAKRETVETLVKEAGRAANISLRETKDAERIIRSYFQKKPTENSFPMHLLAKEKYAKRILMGTNWMGTIDFDNPQNLKYFLNYIKY